MEAIRTAHPVDLVVIWSRGLGVARHLHPWASTSRTGLLRQAGAVPAPFHSAQVVYSTTSSSQDRLVHSWAGGWRFTKGMWAPNPTSLPGKQACVTQAGANGSYAGW